jgi:hypothetical protein
MSLTVVDQGLLGTFAQYTGFKNRIINGSMQVAQRGNVVLSANGSIYGGPDRFILTVGGFSTVSVIALQAGAVFTGSPVSYQIGNLSTTGGPGTVSVVQRIESANTYDLNSQPVTITLQVRQQTGAALNAQIVLRKPTAVDNFASVTLIAASALLPVADSTNTTLTFTTTLGAADATNGLQVDLLFPTVPATSSKQIYTALWQLEKGSTATSFDYRPYGTELALCQRYAFKRLADGSVNNFAPFGMGRYYTTTAVQLYVPFPVTMRTSPSSITVGGTIFVNDSGFGGSDLTSPVLNESSCDGATITGGTASVGIAGYATTFYASNASVASIIFSAEL